MKLLREVIRKNRRAIIFGALIGIIGTRFMEDGNLLVSSVFVFLTSSIALAFRLIFKWVFKI
ncbi:MAG: hypothetical protein EBU43_04445 [Actinobacteria bacterium]|nr:hypothetical protein [Actinomycetota bacterium]NBP91586.1 hypothetical protein [Actinomycetota bacterium]